MYRVLLESIDKKVTVSLKYINLDDILEQKLVQIDKNLNELLWQT